MVRMALSTDLSVLINRDLAERRGNKRTEAHLDERLRLVLYR